MKAYLFFKILRKMQNTVFFSFEILLFVKVGGKKATDFIKLNNFGPMGLFIKGI